VVGPAPVPDHHGTPGTAASQPDDVPAVLDIPVAAAPPSRRPWPVLLAVTTATGIAADLADLAHHAYALWAWLKA
jgi:hypothetical protein